MCLYPKLINNKKYISNKKNGGIIPAVKDHRVLKVPIKCGNCIECRKAIARDWQVRLSEEVRHDKHGKFVTLTFNPQSLKELINDIQNLTGYNLDNQIATLATRRFLERWRKQHKKSVKHWLITELGHQNTEHLHLHGIIFTNQPLEEIEKHWKYGNIWKGHYKTNYVNEKTVNYLIKYVHKQDLIHKEYKPKILCSPGIGAAYTKRHDFKKHNQDIEYYQTRSGHKLSLPIYYRNKAFTEEKREELWLKKLDKHERWIMGQKIDISKTEDKYWKALEAAQALNKTLKYGDDKKNWERKKYENERRMLKIKEKIQHTKRPADSR